MRQYPLSMHHLPLNSASASPLPHPPSAGAPSCKRPPAGATPAPAAGPAILRCIPSQRRDALQQFQQRPAVRVPCHLTHQVRHPEQRVVRCRLGLQRHCAPSVYFSSPSCSTGFQSARKASSVGTTARRPAPCRQSATVPRA